MAPRRLALVALTALAVLALGVPVVHADHHPGVPERVEGRSVYDEGLLGPNGAIIENLAETMASLNDVEVIVVTRVLDETVAVTTAEAETIAQVVGEDWDLSRAVVLAIVAGPDGCDGGASILTFGALPGASLDGAAIVRDELRPELADCDPATAALDGAIAIVRGLVGVAEPPVDATSAAGPPFPDPETDRAVYDHAGAFSPETIASAEATIDAIENRTGAEVVVYSQVVDYGITTEEADAHAQALMDQWGVGRKGFDDGLVILFDLDPSRLHGQVILYGGPGYRAAFLDNGEKQRIFDEDMLPMLRAEDLDGALLIALERVDANATPEHAAKLQTARQIDAAIGLLGAPIVLVGLIGSAMFAWIRYGRDPVYLDDPSIHMAGPPQDLTPASATFVLGGGPSRRSLTTAMLDLASRGLIAFREDPGFLGLNRKVGVVMNPPSPDPETTARQELNAARRLGTAEGIAFKYLDQLTKDEDGYIEPKELLQFGSKVERFNKELEDHVVGRGWFRERPSKVQGRWGLRGGIAVAAGIAAFIGAVNLPSGGLMLIAVALVGGGIVVLVMSRWMQAVTLPGAMIRAMLAAYRRTLHKTMQGSRSMDQVVAEAGLDWLATPDQAVVWGTALGLEEDIEAVLERSLDDLRDGRSVAGSTYFPVWYGSNAGGGASGFAGSGGGLFSSSAVPDFGGMMSALGTIGNSPSSSGGGSGGGFSGGSSGGGGGGSGGGF
jgi:uncharacterized membrane protein YgcG